MELTKILSSSFQINGTSNCHNYKDALLTQLILYVIGRLAGIKISLTSLITSFVIKQIVNTPTPKKQSSQGNADHDKKNATKHATETVLSFLASRVMGLTFYQFLTLTGLSATTASFRFFACDASDRLGTAALKKMGFHSH